MYALLLTSTSGVFQRLFFCYYIADRDRDRDRQYIVANSLKDSDPEAVNAMKRWGVRYVLGENMRHHERPKLRVRSS